MDTKDATVMPEPDDGDTKSQEETQGDMEIPIESTRLEVEAYIASIDDPFHYVRNLYDHVMNGLEVTKGSESSPLYEILTSVKKMIDDRASEWGKWK